MNMESTGQVSNAVGGVSAYLEFAGAGKTKPTVFALHDEVVIGRDPQDSLASDRYLCIPEPTVSRRHARIRRRDRSPWPSNGSATLSASGS